MTVKTKAVEILGEAELMLPAQLASALRGNDQAKILFSVLQAARAHAENAHGQIPQFEHRAAGLGDLDLDDIIDQARISAPGHYAIPEFDRLRDRLLAAIAEMLVPLRSKQSDPAADDFGRRYDGLAEALRRIDGQAVSAAEIDQITSGDRKKGDSLHVLVMDAHKAINRMQAALSEANLDGAQVYGLADGDDALVRAFMSGLNRTAPLKFDHPGLGTTAMRAGQRLTIQNDIGTTDAHVLVIHVDPDAIRLIYTDVHLPRLKFFRSLFPKTISQWNDAEMRETADLADGEPFYMAVALFPGGDAEVRARNLALIGSRLVFLIDWNKARKRLRPFLGKREAIGLLKWAADEDIGHRAFLELGGERLIYEAIETATAGQVRYGETLAEMLGSEQTLAFLKFVFRSASRGLRIGRSPGLIGDQIRAELLSRFRTREQRLLDLVADHAGYTVEIADTVRGAVAGCWSGGSTAAPSGQDSFAARAKKWERAADEIVIALRTQTQGKAEDLVLRRVIEIADDATDDLEEAAYLISLFPGDAAAALYADPLQQLAGQVLDGAREWAKVVLNAMGIRRNADQEEAEDLLVAVDRLVRIERDTDRSLRRVTAALVSAPPDPARFHLATEIARNLEHAADCLTHAALSLHDHVLTDMLRR